MAHVDVTIAQPQDAPYDESNSSGQSLTKASGRRGAELARHRFKAKPASCHGPFIHRQVIQQNESDLALRRVATDTPCTARYGSRPRQPDDGFNLFAKAAAVTTRSIAVTVRGCQVRASRLRESRAMFLRPRRRPGLPFNLTLQTVATATASSSCELFVGHQSPAHNRTPMATSPSLRRWAVRLTTSTPLGGASRIGAPRPRSRAALHLQRTVASMSVRKTPSGTSPRSGLCCACPPRPEVGEEVNSSCARANLTRDTTPCAVSHS